MNIFDKLRVYAGSWSVKSSRQFTADEVSAVKSAVVVDSQYGKSVCFFLNSGGQTYLPLSTNSTLETGEMVDVSTAKIITLSKQGEADIERVEA